MTNQTDRTDGAGLDRDDKSFRYYRHAVERHWDPCEIDLTRDREVTTEMNPKRFSRLRVPIAMFGAGEQAVTDDLSPLAQVLESSEDQAFITTQLYEEAKHTDFFDRYWQEVIYPAEEAHGLTHMNPWENRYVPDAYDELFARNKRALERLLENDTAENRALAYCHYHLAVEGILAQTGYYKLQQSYGENESESGSSGSSGDSDDSGGELPHLSGLVEGIQLIRQDEGRHVGFGMAKLKQLVESDAVKLDVLCETVSELAVLVTKSVAGGIQNTDEYNTDKKRDSPSPTELREYAMEKYRERMRQIIDGDHEVPTVEIPTN